LPEPEPNVQVELNLGDVSGMASKGRAWLARYRVAVGFVLLFLIAAIGAWFCLKPADPALILLPSSEGEGTLNAVREAALLR